MRRVVLAGWIVMLMGAAGAVAQTPSEETGRLQDQLRASETAFAKTMADRDVEAFATFLSDEAIFFGRRELRDKAAIVEAWSAYFTGKDAPFSWQHDMALVLDSGTLGLTSGPVFDPQGNRIGTNMAGTATLPNAGSGINLSSCTGTVRPSGRFEGGSAAAANSSATLVFLHPPARGRP